MSEFKILIDDEKVFLSFPYDPEILANFKNSVYGRNWDARRRQWWTGFNFLSMYTLVKFAKKHQWPVSSMILDKMSAAGFKERFTLSSSKKLDRASECNYDERLYEFQKVGVHYATEAGQCFIADQMGLGKTPISLLAARERNAFPLLIVCPAISKYKWQREVEQWLNMEALIINGLTPYEIDSKIEIVIMNYEILRGWVYPGVTKARKPFLNAIKWKGIILDESHRIANHKAQQTRAALRLGAVKSVHTKFCLSGTPFKNHPGELITQLRFLGRMTELGGTKQFRVHFCMTLDELTGRYMYNAARNLTDLNALLRSSCMVRHLKKDVLTQLPRKIRSVIEVDIKQKDYMREEDDYIRWLVVTKNLNEDTFESAAETLSRMDALRLSVAKDKFELALSWVEDFLSTADDSEKLIVWAYHHEVQDMLVNEFPRAARILYNTSDKKRRDEQVRFRDDPTCRVIICSMMAAKEAIDLTAANNQLFIELPWTSSDLEQMEDRSHRIGQSKVVNIYYLIAKGTVDEDQMSVLDEKRAYQHLGLDGKLRKGELLKTAAEKSKKSDIVNKIIARILLRARLRKIKHQSDVTIDMVF